jgi:hypothetical protein
MELVTVFRSLRDAEAQVVRSRLDAAGIPVTIRNEKSNLAGSAGIAGIEFLVEVPEINAADARSLIDAPQDDAP